MEEDDVVENEDDEYEPQVNSSNPQERKLARRLRIQRRAEAAQKLLHDLAEGEVEDTETRNAIQSQVEKSAELMEKLILDGDEYVTNVRVANEAREADRREKEGFAKEDVIQQLEEEAAAAEEKFNEIAGKWSEVLGYNDPLHINDELLSQKEKCDDLIKQKDAVITMLKNELRTAEINFGIDQRKQIQDISSLTRRIENQLMVMRKAFRQELQYIEDVIMAERKTMIEANDKKWDELAKRREQDEKANSDLLIDEQDNFIEQMTELRHDFEERFREAKIRMENGCEELQCELERIKALAVINSEKLDYSYQILKKREDENLIIKTQQKRKINKMQDVINSLRRKISDYQQQTMHQIKKLTLELKTLHNSIMDIERKADHFAKVNDQKFHKVWNMNDRRAKEILEKILETDRVLHEQQLGIEWRELDCQLFSKEDLESFATATTAKTEELVEEKPSQPAAKQSSSVAEQEEKAVTEDKDNKVYKKIMKMLLHHISDRSDFLIEEQLKLILEPYAEDEKTLVRVDNVFCALNITKKEDIDKILKYFMPYMYCPICSSSSKLSQTGSEQQERQMNGQELDEKSEVTRERSGSLMASADDSGTTESTSTMSRSQIGVERPSGLSTTSSGFPSIFSKLKAAEDVCDYSESEIKHLTLTEIEDDLHGECRGHQVDESFYSKEIQEREAASNEEVTQEKVECQYHHPLIISSAYVLKALKEFLTSFHVPKPSVPTMTDRIAHKRSTVSRNMSVPDVEMYWRKFTTIFSKDRETLWDSLLEGLKRYHELLKARKQLSEEVVGLRKQNKELRRVFANYSYMDS